MLENFPFLSGIWTEFELKCTKLYQASETHNREACRRWWTNPTWKCTQDWKWQTLRELGDHSAKMESDHSKILSFSGIQAQVLWKKI